MNSQENHDKNCFTNTFVLQIRTNKKEIILPTNVSQYIGNLMNKSTTNNQ